MHLQPILSRHEIGLLRGVLEGRAQAVPSSHRLRFEMLGLIRDRPQGLELTVSGKQRATAPLLRSEDDAERDAFRSAPGR
jgi:hypothetical protein